MSASAANKGLNKRKGTEAPDLSEVSQNPSNQPSGV
jgi:hypothetical protein